MQPVKSSKVTLLILAIFFSLFLPNLSFAAPPQNFQTTEIIGYGLDGPSGFEFAPDGRIFILERTGKVKIYKNGQILAESFVDLPSIAEGDRGLIGIAFDPDYASNKYVYFYYTGLDKLNRLVRCKATTDKCSEGPYELYRTTSPSEQLHVGGSIAFGPDGKLYFAIGDNGYSAQAQWLDNPHGKILRINKDGSIPTDNPFYNTPGAKKEIWAYGFRNPWRFQFDPSTGRMYGGDVGDNTWEEVNKIEKGKNYGWPTCEGNCNVGGMTNPLYTYNHDGMSSAVTGGPVYRGTMFPLEYRDSLFFSDYARGFIKRIDLDENGNMQWVFDFDTNAGSVVDMKVASDGSLYYLTYYPGRLYRVSYASNNHIPVANANADKTKGVEPFTVRFSSQGSYDPDGDPLSYDWSLGDGTHSYDANPTKTYYQKGTYTVELTVSDGKETAKSTPIVIEVGIAPTVTIGRPKEGDTYKAGDTIIYNAHAVDGSGRDINDNDISTEIIMHHGTHIHPFLGPLKGREGSFTTPTSGEPSPDTWFEIKVTATDTSGLASTKSVNVYPILSSMTLTTAPEGLQLTLDGAPITSPHSVEGVVNFRREIGAPATQTKDGVPYQFVGWSDGGARIHTVTFKDTPATYTATYTPVNLNFRGEYFSNKYLTGTPAVTRTDNAINFDWGISAPAQGVPADEFSVRWTTSQFFAAGTYRFSTTTDDGVRLKIDGQTVIDQWIDQSATTHVAEVTLAAGNHTIVMEYYDNYYDAVAKLAWETKIPTGQCPEPAVNAFTGCYYNNNDFTDWKASRTDSYPLDFSWGEAKPHEAIDKDTFSVKWEGQFSFGAQDYVFTVAADDGVRLYIDNELVIDKWIDQSTTVYTTTQSMTEGVHTIRLEYYDNYYDAVAKLDWKPTTSGGNTFASTFTIHNPNEWWQQVDVDPDDGRTINSVMMRRNDGAWEAMELRSWGHWAISKHAPAGTKVEFLAIDAAGAASQSEPFTWLDGTTTKRSTTAPAEFTADFYLSPNVNSWWAEVNVESMHTIVAVDMQINSGSWIALEKMDWGNWAKSIYIASGSTVRFRAKDSAGKYAHSTPTQWP